MMELDECHHCGRPDENELCEECYGTGWRLCEECGALGSVGVYGQAEYICADCEEDADRALSEEAAP